jgi:4-hydroxybenzoate polyprenyltransferase
MTLATLPVETVAAPRARESALPLVVDLDGTLARSDLVAEAALAYLRSNPLHLFTLLFWLVAGGRKGLRRGLAARVEIDVSHLPLNEELVALLERERKGGRAVYLATSADAPLAAGIAGRLGFVDGVIASDRASDFTAERRARALSQRFPQGFAYAGSARADLAVWRAASESVVVGASSSVRKASEAIRPASALLNRKGVPLRAVLKAARVHQWAKNGLVFVPMVLGGRAFDPSAWIVVGAGFLCLGVLASATYLLNDLWDIEDDRRHWSKRERAFASGRLPIVAGLIAAPLGIAVALGGAALIGPAAFASLVCYLVVTLAYSFRLKKVAVLDVFTLASLFTLRLVIGIALALVMASPWLLVFSMFVFSSLSFAKRHTEMVRVARSGANKAAGRGYVAADAPFLIGMGVATGMSAVLVMVLYLINEAFRAGFYATPGFLWTFPCVLFLWLGRVWVLSGRDELNDDPVAFAVKDGPSIMLGLVMALAFAAAVTPARYAFW